jgi:hypothetical protein
LSTWSWFNACALKEDETIECFGWLSSDPAYTVPVNPFPGEKVSYLSDVDVAFGARTTDGRFLFQVREPWVGQFESPRYIPGDGKVDTDLPGDHSFSKLAYSPFGLCGIVESGKVKCWGTYADSRSDFLLPPESIREPY